MSGTVKVFSPDQKKQLLTAIAGNVALPPVSRSYVVGLLFTAFAALLLPCLYLSVMALVIISLFAFFRHADWIMDGWPSYLRILAVGIVGCVNASLVLGLVKPFLARSSTVKRTRALRRDVEPFLYDYVNRLCDALGARRPTEIQINYDLNAAAEFQRGWPSLFRREGISLHLGLPLVAGLTLRQFTGVLAHELGHFTQRSGNWLESIVRNTNLWIHRVAHEQDSIDEWLTRSIRRGGLLAIPCYVARFVVWITRQVAQGLALLGTSISCLMLREMEFNADRCEVRTVGAKTLAATMWRLRQLSLAHQLAFRDIAAFYSEGRLPDNIVSLVVANTSFMTPKVKKKLRRMMLDQKTGLFDSHPSDQDRIRAASLDDSPGLFDSSGLKELPATVLFSRFDEISKMVTLDFYGYALNQKINSRILHPVKKLLERETAEIDAAKALRRYFQADIPSMRPLPIASESSAQPEHPQETLEQLKASRERMMSELPEYKRLAPRYQMAEETLFETIQAQALIQARLQFNPADYHLDEAKSEPITDKQSRAREGLANLAGRLLAFENEAGNRLSFALQLLQVPGVTRKIVGGDELLYEVDELLPEALFVSHLIAELPTLRIVSCRLSTLCERSNGQPQEKPLSDLLISQRTTLRGRLQTIQREMGNRLYPFDHAKADATFRSYALPEIPAETDLRGLLKATEKMESRLVTIQTRLFARLAQAAERVEAAIGMPPLPEPDNNTDEFQ